MINETKLPRDFVEGLDVWKLTLEGIDEVQCLSVAPYTSIKRHGHENQWEVWLHLNKRIAYICPKNEEHELKNDSDKMEVFMAIKGHKDYSYKDLAAFFIQMEFGVWHGSVHIKKVREL